jgi:hypothetical protein
MEIDKAVMSCGERGAVSVAWEHGSGGFLLLAGGLHAMPIVGSRGGCRYRQAGQGVENWVVGVWLLIMDHHAVAAAWAQRSGMLG